MQILRITVHMGRRSRSAGDPWSKRWRTIWTLKSNTRICRWLLEQFQMLPYRIRENNEKNGLLVGISTDIQLSKPSSSNFYGNSKWKEENFCTRQDICVRFELLNGLPSLEDKNWVSFGFSLLFCRYLADLLLPPK